MRQLIFIGVLLAGLAATVVACNIYVVPPTKISADPEINTGATTGGAVATSASGSAVQAEEIARLEAKQKEKDAEIVRQAEELKNAQEAIAQLQKENEDFLSGFPLVDVGITGIEIIAEHTTSEGAISGPFAVKVSVTNQSGSDLTDVRVLATLNASSAAYPKSMPLSTRRQKTLGDLANGATQDVIILGFTALFPDIQQELVLELSTSAKEENNLDNIKKIQLLIAPPSGEGE